MSNFVATSHGFWKFIPQEKKKGVLFKIYETSRSKNCKLANTVISGLMQLHSSAWKAHFFESIFSDPYGLGDKHASKTDVKFWFCLLERDCSKLNLNIGKNI